MAFQTIDQLTAYINSTIKTNGIKSITGDQMNAVLIGILQFLQEQGSGTVSSIIAASPLTGGTITSTGTIGIPRATIGTDGYLKASDYAVFLAKGNGTVTSVTADSTLNGGTITTSGTIGLPNTGSSGIYGDASHVPQITTDPQGRVTSVSVIPITGTTGYVVTDYISTSTATTQVIATGLGFTPSVAIAIPLDVYSGTMLYTKNIFYTYGVGTVSITFTSVNGGTLNFKVISFK